MQEKPPGEALIEMDALEPGRSPRRPNGAAGLALMGGILVAILGLLLVASKPRDPLPAPWWYALLILSGMTTLLALLGWAKSTGLNTAGRKRSLWALMLGVTGIVVAFWVGSNAFFPKPPAPPTTAPSPKRIGTATTRRSAASRVTTTREVNP